MGEMANEAAEGNRVRELRENKLMTQAQLARKAKVALRTIHSVEKGMNCRMDTKRKILLALGLRFEDNNERFGLEIRRGVVQFHETLPDHADFTMVTDRAYLNRILVGEVAFTGEMAAAIEQGAPAAVVAIIAAIDSGDIKVEGGTKEDIVTFFAYFDEPVDVGAINLIVR